MIHVVIGHQLIHAAVIEGQPGGQGHRQQQPVDLYLWPPQLEGGQQDGQSDDGHAPQGGEPQHAEAEGPDIEGHAPEGGDQYHAGRGQQQAAVEAQGELLRPGPPGQQQQGQVQHRHGHQLEEAAAGVFGKAAADGRRLVAAEEDGELDEHEQQIDGVEQQERHVPGKQGQPPGRFAPGERPGRLVQTVEQREAAQTHEQCTQDDPAHPAQAQGLQPVAEVGEQGAEHRVRRGQQDHDYGQQGQSQQQAREQGSAFAAFESLYPGQGGEGPE